MIDCERHPTERGRGGPVVAAGSSCTCCCCLHTIGALVTACKADAPRWGKAWWLLTALILVLFSGLAIDSYDGWMPSLLIAALVGTPAAMIAAAVILGGVIRFTEAEAEATVCLEELGDLAGRGFFGCLVGGLVMFVLVALMSGC